MMICCVLLSNITFEDVYERWSDEHFPTVSDSNVKGYRAAWALCDKLARMRFVDVKLDHLQMIVDESGKNYPTLRKLKVLLGLMYKYAVIHEIIPKERNLVEYLDIKKAGNPNAYNRKPLAAHVLAMPTSKGKRANVTIYFRHVRQRNKSSLLKIK